MVETKNILLGDYAVPSVCVGLKTGSTQPTWVLIISAISDRPTRCSLSEAGRITAGLIVISLA